MQISKTAGSLPKIPIFVLSILIILFGVLSLTHYRSAPKYVDWKSLEIADSLITNGQFTNGGHVHTSRLGQDFPPAYPATIAALTWLMPSMSAELHCLATQQRKCHEKLLIHTLILAQVLAAFLTLMFLFFLAWELSYSYEIALLTVLLFLFSAGLTKFSQSLLLFTYVTLLTIAASYFLVLTFRRHKSLYAFSAGVLLALAALFYPPFILLPLFSSIILLFALHASFARRTGSGLALLLGAITILAPWILRNYYWFDEPTIANQSSIRMLAARVAYNNMSASEIFASFIISLPNIGESLARIFFSPEIVDRLANAKGPLFVNPAEIIAETKIQGQNVWQYSRIISRHIWGDLIGYLTTTPSLFIQGIWGGSTIGLFGMAFFWPVLKRLRSSKNTVPFLLVASILASGVLAQALLDGTRNPHHFNSQILFIHAYVIAYLTGGLELPKILRAGKMNSS